MNIYADTLERAATRLEAGPPLSVGPYRVTMVDEAKIRSSSEDLEEYTNYAVASDFPDDIQPDEIWLSDHVPADERWILVEEAVARIEAERNGASAEEAYKAGLQRSRVLRHRRKADGPAHADDHVRIKRLGYAGTVAVWLVDGEAIRNTVDSDYVEGGHSCVYSWIPKNEIWIDQEVPEDERPFILAHEYHEFLLMRDGVPYEAAHKQASHYEWRIRESVSSDEDH